MFNKDVAGPRGLVGLERSDVRPTAGDVIAELPCRLAHIGNQSYGKLPEAAVGDQIFMEYKHFRPFVAKYVPDGVLRRSANFNTFLRRESATRLFELADFMMLTLPKPRIDFYKSSDFLDI